LAVPLHFSRCPTISPPSRPTLLPYTTLFRSFCVSPLARSIIQTWPFSFLKARRLPSGDQAGAYSAPGRSVTCCVSPVSTFMTYRSEEHTSELQSRFDLVCRLLLAKKKKTTPS